MPRRVTCCSPPAAARRNRHTRVPDAAQRDTHKGLPNSFIFLASRCAANPGPPRPVRLPGLLRSVSRCAAPGKRVSRYANSCEGRALLDSHIFQRQAAVDDELEAGDVAALIARKIERGIGDIPGRAPEAHGHLARSRLPDLLFAAIGCGKPS
jgi:hypothetical protein